MFSPFVEGTTPFRPDNVTSFFIRVRNEVDAPNVRLHDFRHFTATQLIGAGMDVRTVAGLLVTPIRLSLFGFTAMRWRSVTEQRRQ